MQTGNYIDKEKGVLVAVSGGADSIVLLHWLVSHGYYCIAAHCNFQLRGAESDSDEEFVRSFCDELSVPCHVIHFDTKKYAAERRISIEMAARELRYQWFDKLLDQLDLPCVAVAHHADDAVETFLLNLVRGTGIKGLSGMKIKQGRVVRPMLKYSRQDIELYCRAHKLKYVTDSSNSNDAYMRNRIRHQVVPQLKAINPSFLSTMRGNMMHLDQICALFASQVEAFTKRAVVEVEDQMLISMEHLLALPNPEPFLFELLFGKGFRPDAIHKMARCINEKRWGRVLFAPQYRAVVDRYNVIVLPRDAEEEEEEFDIESGRDEVFTPLHLSIRQFPMDLTFELSRTNDTIDIDAEKIEFPLRLRRWKQGDTFRPLGMKGFKKLSDFFVDNKLSRVEKERAWVLLSGDEIVWIVGMRIDDRYKVTPNTTEILEI